MGKDDDKKVRQIVIETDGQKIWFKKMETSSIELVAICNMIIQHAMGPKKNKSEQP